MDGGRPDLRVEMHPECRLEVHALTVADPREATAIDNAHRILVSMGRDPGFPLTSAVRGAGSDGLRELRPRAGRSRYRVILARHGSTLVLLALAPEAVRDPRGFVRAVRHARQRLASLTKEPDPR